MTKIINAFSPEYKSQLDLSDMIKHKRLIDSAQASLKARRESDDLRVRRSASGSIPGLSKKGDASIAKLKSMKQPPKNARAMLEHNTDPGKSAKLSRGRSI